MDNKNAKIYKTVLSKAHIDIDPLLSGTLELKTENHAIIKPPKETDNKTALVDYSMQLSTVEDDRFKIDISAEIYFEFIEIPNNYAEVGEQICIPMAKEELYKTIDKLLIDMGKPPLKIVSEN